MTAAAYEATFQTLFLLTSEEDLADLVSSDAVAMLHEDLLTADTTGREGSSDLLRGRQVRPIMPLCSHPVAAAPQ